MNKNVKIGVQAFGAVALLGSCFAANSFANSVKYTKLHPSEAVKHSAKVLKITKDLENLDSNFQINKKVGASTSPLSLSSVSSDNTPAPASVASPMPVVSSVVKDDNKTNINLPNLTKTTVKKYSVKFVDEDGKVLDVNQPSQKYTKLELSKVNKAFAKKGSLLKGSKVTFISGGASFNFDKNQFEIPTFNDYTKLVLPSQVKLVTLGDSYSAAYSPYGGDKVHSYADYLAKDLKASHRLSSFDKSEATSGEMTWQTMKKIGVKSSQIDMSYMNVNDFDAHKLTSSELSKSRIDSLRSKLKSANLITITDNGNDLMSIIKILGHRITSLASVVSSDKNMSVKLKLSDALRRANMLYSRNKIQDIEKGNTGSDLLDIIGKVMYAAKHNLAGIVTIGPKHKVLDIKSLMGAKDPISGLKQSASGAELIKELNSVAANQKNLEKEIRSINKNALIIHVGYPFPWSNVKAISAKGSSIFDSVVDIFKRGTTANHNLYLELGKEQGFSTKTSAAEFSKNLPNVLDIHPSTHGQREIANIIEKKYSRNVGKVSRTTDLFNDPFQTKEAMAALEEKRTLVNSLLDKLTSGKADFSIKSILGLIESNADENNVQIKQLNSFVETYVTSLIANESKFGSNVNKVKFALLSITDTLHKNNFNSKEDLMKTFSALNLKLPGGAAGAASNLLGPNDMNKITEYMTNLISHVDGMSDNKELADLKDYESKPLSQISIPDHLNYFLISTFASDSKNGRNQGVNEWVNYVKSLNNVKNLTDTNQALVDAFNKRVGILSKSIQLEAAYQKVKSNSALKLTNDISEFENHLAKAHFDDLESLNPVLEKDLKAADSSVDVNEKLTDDQIKEVEKKAVLISSSEVMQMWVFDVASLAA